jgi:hypothetical protein
MYFDGSQDIAEGFQAELAVLAGVSPNSISDPVATWLDMNGAALTWIRENTTPGTTETATWELTIRSKNNLQDLAVAQYTLSLQKF